MRKHLLFNLLFISIISFVSNTSYSQTSIYKPFPTLYGMWELQSTGPWGPGENTKYWWDRYEANGDTIIGSYTYKKVYGASGTKPGYPTVGISYGPVTYNFAYRNDVPNKKVYIHKNINGQNKDTLWYDFNLNIGDTLKNTYSLRVDNSVDQRTIVTSIDSILICNVYYKRFNFGCGNAFTDLGLIEGYGFEDNFIQTGHPYCPFEPVYLYHTDFFCSLSSVADRPHLNDPIQLFPNPASNTLQINFSDQFHYNIADCLGKIISSGITNAGSIDISNLPAGIYFIVVEDQQQKQHPFKFVKQ